METASSADREEFRSRIITLVLIAATALLLYLSYGIIKPFIPVISWAVALTAVFYPVQRKLVPRVGREDLAAAISVALITVCILLPLGIAARQIVRQGVQSAQVFSKRVDNGNWERMLSGANRERLAWLNENFHLSETINDLGARAGSLTTSIFSGSIYSIFQFLLILFSCFFFLRDRSQILRAIRGLVPLTARETEEVFTLVDDTIHAIVYGTVVVSIVQGMLGALIFWWLELPAPLVWGFVMALLSIVPYLGAFVIWGPIALYLALSGNWTDAVILTTWGTFVIGLIDNLLYPMLVGKRLRFHTLLVFFFILGGLAFFGASGLVLGPLTLALLNAMREIWSRRLAAGTADPAPQAGIHAENISVYSGLARSSK